MSDVLTAILAAELAGSGASVPTFKKIYPLTGSPIVGDVVQLLTDGTVAALPEAKTWTNSYSYETSFQTQLSSQLTPNGYVSGIYPTTDPAVFVQIWGTSQTSVQARMFRVNADGSMTAGANLSIPGAQHQRIVRMPNTDTWVATYYTGSSPYSNFCVATTMNPATLTISAWGAAVQLTLANAGGSSPWVEPIDSNTLLILTSGYVSPNYTTYLTVVSLSGSTISYGTPIALGSAGASNYANDGWIVPYSATQILVRANGILYGITRSGLSLSASIGVTLPNATLNDGGKGVTKGFQTNVYTEQITPTRHLVVYGCYNTPTGIQAAFVDFVGGVMSISNWTTLYNDYIQAPAASTNYTWNSIQVLNVSATKRFLSFNQSYWTQPSANSTRSSIVAMSFNVTATSITSDNNQRHIFTNDSQSYYCQHVGWSEMFPDGTVMIHAKWVVGAGASPAQYYQNYGAGVRLKMLSDGTWGIMSTQGYGVPSPSQSTLGWNAIRGSRMHLVNGVYNFFDFNYQNNSSQPILRRFNFTGFNRGRVWGILQNDGSVVCQGISNSHADLNAGLPVGYDPTTGDLASPYGSAIILGRAISATEILIPTTFFSDPAV